MTTNANYTPIDATFYLAKNSLTDFSCCWIAPGTTTCQGRTLKTFSGTTYSYYFYCQFRINKSHPDSIIRTNNDDASQFTFTISYPEFTTVNTEITYDDVTAGKYYVVSRMINTDSNDSGMIYFLIIRRIF